jgi:general stress protein CsbA
MNKFSILQYWKIGIILLLGAVGMGLVYYATRWGPVVFSDSVYYLGSADNLVHGRGFGLYWGDNHFRPFAGDPPFYPFVVAFFQLSGLGVVTAARWVGILSFVILVAGSGWLAYDLTHSPGLAVGTSLFLFFPALQVSTNASSETVFFPATLLGGMLILRYLITDNRFNLILAAILAAAAFLSRYVGVALLVTSVLALMFFSTTSWKKRILDGLLLCLIVGIPTLMWLGWGYFHTSTLGERTMHAPDIASFAIKFKLAFADILWKWIVLLPDTAGYEIKKWGALFLLVLLAMIAGWAMWRSLKKPAAGTVWLWSGFFALYALVYLFIYFGAYVYTVPTPDLIPRIFDPFLLASGLCLLGLAVLVAQGRQPYWMSSALAVVLALLFMVPAIPANADYIVAMHEDGYGYTGRSWSQSPVLAAVKELPPNTQIITNQPDAVLFLTGRPAHWIPEVVSEKPVASFTRFGDGGEYQENVFRYDGGALVLFPDIYWQMQSIYYGQTEERIASMLNGLTVYRQFGDYAGIYFYPDQ